MWIKETENELEECKRKVWLDEYCDIKPNGPKSEIGNVTLLTNEDVNIGYMETAKLIWDNSGLYGLYNIEYLQAVLTYFKKLGRFYVGIYLYKDNHPLQFFGFDNISFQECLAVSPYIVGDIDTPVTNFILEEEAQCKTIKNSIVDSKL